MFRRALVMGVMVCALLVAVPDPPASASVTACGLFTASSRYSDSSFSYVVSGVSCRTGQRVLARAWSAGPLEPGRPVRVVGWRCRHVRYFDPGLEAFRCTRRGARASAIWLPEMEPVDLLAAGDFV